MTFATRGIVLAAIGILAAGARAEAGLAFYPTHFESGGGIASAYRTVAGPGRLDYTPPPIDLAAPPYSGFTATDRDVRDGVVVTSPGGPVAAWVGLGGEKDFVPGNGSYLRFDFAAAGHYAAAFSYTAVSDSGVSSLRVYDESGGLLADRDFDVLRTGFLGVVTLGGTRIGAVELSIPSTIFQNGLAGGGFFWDSDSSIDAIDYVAVAVPEPASVSGAVSGLLALAAIGVPRLARIRASRGSPV